ncbi:MAG TPA: TetR/AcrR family transcriptional regulator [Pseudonocardiaceae bacterium]
MLGLAEKRTRLPAAQRRAVIERAATEVFAERGYHGAGMDEIAARSGISVPVLYDHFPSKQRLHRQLLEAHFADLRAIWRNRLTAEQPPGGQVADAFDAWFGYVETHPYAWRMLFRDTTGDPTVAQLHREVAEASRAAMLPLFARQLPTALANDEHAVAMAWEVVRAALQGLALWWSEQPGVPRERVVAMAMNLLWIGFERLQRGATW